MPSMSPWPGWSIPSGPDGRRCSSWAARPSVGASSCRRPTKRARTACSRPCRWPAPRGSAPARRSCRCHGRRALRRASRSATCCCASRRSSSGHRATSSISTCRGPSGCTTRSRWRRRPAAFAQPCANGPACRCRSGAAPPSSWRSSRPESRSRVPAPERTVCTWSPRARKASSCAASRWRTFRSSARSLRSGSRRWASRPWGTC